MPAIAVSSRWDSLLAERSLEDLLRLIPNYDPIATAEDCAFDIDEAARAVDFFNDHLRHVKGEIAGDAFSLDPWLASITANLFGWKRQDGTRRYRKAFIYVPKKQAKTLWAASVCNYVLFCDGEPGAEIYTVAAERGQAGISFDIAKQQVLMDQKLRHIAKVFRSAITIDSMGSTFRPLSAEASSKHGYNVHLLVVDELHAQKDPELVETLEQGTAARRQPLVIYITTADYDRESICNTKLKYALQVRNGDLKNFEFLPVIYRAERGDDWRDPAIWSKANPGLGRSVKLDFMAAECKKAQEIPTFENTFKRLHLNMTTEQDIRWMPMDRWRDCKLVTTAEDIKGAECFAGIDLSSTKDVSAVVLAFPRIDGRVFVLPFFWIPRVGAERREQAGEKVSFLTWQRQGFVTMTDGDRIDYDFIRARINELGKLYRIREIAADPWNAQQICTQLQGDGFEMKMFRQGFVSMTGPSKELERLVAEGKLDHGGNPILEWMAGNVSVELDAAGNIKPSKKKSHEKIDGIVALVMALGLAQVAKPKKVSPYHSRGFLQI